MTLPAAFKNQSKQSDQETWYALTTNAKKKHLDIYLYGVIGGWRVNVNNFIADIKSAGNVDTITVYINTVGGTFYDGLAINNTLKQHSAFVTIKVMGYALSMGSYLLTGADHVECASNALIMAHRAQGGVWGDAARMQHTANILEKHENASLIPDFMRVLGKSENEVKALLQKETWWTAAEAKDAGLIHEIIGEVDLDEAEETLSENAWSYAAKNFKNPIHDFSNRFDLHVENSQRQEQPLLQRLLNKMTGTSNPVPINKDEDDMTPEQITALAEAIGNKFTEANQPLIESINKLEQKFDNTSPAGNPAPASDDNPDEDLQTQLDKAHNDLTAANATIAELSQPDPSKNTETPENTGPAGELDGWDQETNLY